jgi:hypothetical protein
MGPKKDNDSKVKRKITASVTVLVMERKPSSSCVHNHLGSRNGLIHFTLILMGKIVSVYEHFGSRTDSRNGLSS